MYLATKPRVTKTQEGEEDDEDPWSRAELEEGPAKDFPWWTNMAESGGGCEVEAVVASLDAPPGGGAPGPTAGDLGLEDEHAWGED